MANAQAKQAGNKKAGQSRLAMAGGAAAGAAAGALVGPLGAAIGAVVGGVAGAHHKEIADNAPGVAREVRKRATAAGKSVSGVRKSLTKSAKKAPGKAAKKKAAKKKAGKKSAGKR